MLKTTGVSKNARVLHVASGFKMRAADVETGVENCALAWVVYGQTFRTLTEEEAIAARNERARKMARLAAAEIPGVVFRPPEMATEQFRREMELAARARDYTGEEPTPWALRRSAVREALAAAFAEGAAQAVIT